jgi:glycosyltransferase involved in cell wall biosynthesis
MRIAFITLGYRPMRTSGLDISGERLVQGLLDKGHQVTVIAGKSAPIAETHTHPKLKIYRIALGRTDWIGCTYRAAQLLKHLAPFDIVHFWDVHFSWAYRGNYVASLQHSFRQRRISLGPLSPDPFWLYRYIYYTLARNIAEIPSVRRSRGLLAGSSTTHEEFIKYYEVDPHRIAIAKHGVDTNFFSPVSSVREVRDQLGIHSTDAVILFVGFITPRKGLEYLIQALPLITPRPKLVIVGKWRNISYRRQLMQLIDPIKDAVIEAGFVCDELMPTYYTLADVFVSPTLLEGFGLPLAESLACGTPVVTAEAGSTSEVLGPGGISVPQRDSKSLAIEISQLLQDESLRRELGEKGRKHIQENFSLEAMINDTLSAYQRFL